MDPSVVLIRCMDIVGNAIIGTLNMFYRLWVSFDMGYFLYPLMALSAIMAFFVKPLIGHANDIRGAYESKKLVNLE